MRVVSSCFMRSNEVQVLQEKEELENTELENTAFQEKICKLELQNMEFAEELRATCTGAAVSVLEQKLQQVRHSPSPAPAPLYHFCCTPQVPYASTPIAAKAEIVLPTVTDGGEM
ncbi:hypothetical protein ACHWQZ_G014068 [Mnemiopsis leidyi]